MIKINRKLNSLNDQSTSIKNNIKLKVSKDFGSYANKNIKQNSSILIKINLESSNTSSGMNKLYESPIPMHLRSKDNEKEKSEKDKLNNFKRAYDKKYSISPTMQIKRDHNGNNNEIGEFKLELRSIF